MLVHTSIFGDRLPFLPLLLISSYNAVGLAYTWVLSYMQLTRKLTVIRSYQNSPAMKAQPSPSLGGFGKFKLNVWRDKIYDEYHFSLSMGNINEVESPLVRVQTQSILQDLLGIDELGKNWSIRNSLKKISEEGTGLFVLINHRDAKSYWLNKLEEKQIEPKSNRRVIGVGSQILRALNLKKITVLGTPTKYNAVSGFDIEITGFKNE